MSAGLFEKVSQQKDHKGKKREIVPRKEGVSRETIRSNRERRINDGRLKRVSLGKGRNGAPTCRHAEETGEEVGYDFSSSILAASRLGAPGVRGEPYDSSRWQRSLPRHGRQIRFIPIARDTRNWTHHLRISEGERSGEGCGYYTDCTSLVFYQ